MVLLGSDWLESGEESDARTIRGYLLLRKMVPEEGSPEVRVELLAPAEGDRGGLRLNPPREQRRVLTERDEVVVLTTYA